jgi:mono/diheme cytochrome c family protein
VLAAKVLVIRRFQRFGHRLPWLGGALCAGAVAATALVAPAGARLLVVFEPDPGGRLAAGGAVVHGRCLQCHGPTRIAGEDEDLEGWREEIAEMQRRAARTAGVRAITDAEAELAAAFLAAALPDEPGDEGRDDDRGRRRRGRR